MLQVRRAVRGAHFPLFPGSPRNRADRMIGSPVTLCSLAEPPLQVQFHSLQEQLRGILKLYVAYPKVGLRAWG